MKRKTADALPASAPITLGQAIFRPRRQRKAPDQHPLVQPLRRSAVREAATTLPERPMDAARTEAEGVVGAVAAEDGVMVKLDCTPRWIGDRCVPRDEANRIQAMWDSVIIPKRPRMIENEPEVGECFFTEWPDQTQVGWWNHGRKQLNEVIRAVNEWTLADRPREEGAALLRRIDMGLKTFATVDGGSGWAEELRKMRRYVERARETGTKP